MDESRLYAVVLAAGEGKRLASLTRALYGRHLPKQFAVLDGDRSLLQATLERIAPLVPPTRTVVVVGREQAALAEEQLRPFPGLLLVRQPRNLDTGPGILLPLARILAADPGATVAVFPADHYVPNPAPFVRALREAASLARGTGGWITLLGALPDGPETEYGWILPGPRLEGASGQPLHQVRRFVEKPSPDLARQLLARGGLWNTFVLVGRLFDIWCLAERHLPVQAALFKSYVCAVGGAREERVLDAIYERMPAAGFSRAVLERADRLAVAPVSGTGWTDWGRPSRVFRSLAEAGHLTLLRQRLLLHPPAPSAA